MTLLKLHRDDVDKETNDGISHLTHPRIERWLDVRNIPGVLRLAVPEFLTSTSVDESLQERLFVAIGCSDSSIHLVSVPLTAASTDTSRNRAAHAICTRLAPTHEHHGLISALAVTFIASEDNSKELGFLIASASATSSGLLLVHYLALAEHLNEAKGGAILTEKAHLQLPLAQCSLDFSPNCDGTLLVVARAVGIVKILRVKPVSYAAGEGRKLRHLLTLHAPYDTEAENLLHDQILDAKWCRRGKSVIAVLSSANFGVWDVDGLDLYDSGTKRYTRKRAQLTRPDKFSFTGSMSSTAPIIFRSSTSRTANGDQPWPSRLAVFKPSAWPATGSIVRYAQPGRQAIDDDSFILSCGGINDLLPSLHSLHQSASNDKIRLQSLPSVKMASERELLVNSLSMLSRKDSIPQGSSETATELLSVTTSRISFLRQLRRKSHAKRISSGLLIRDTATTTVPISGLELIQSPKEVNVGIIDQQAMHAHDKTSQATTRHQETKMTTQNTMVHTKRIQPLTDKYSSIGTSAVSDSSSSVRKPSIIQKLNAKGNYQQARVDSYDSNASPVNTKAKSASGTMYQSPRMQSNASPTTNKAKAELHTKYKSPRADSYDSTASPISKDYYMSGGLG